MILAAQKSLTALNKILNAPSNSIPSQYNGIRGKLFEEWRVGNMGVVAPGPIFMDDGFSTADRKRQAEGIRVQGNMLVDAKVWKGGKPDGDAKAQMIDYGIIIRNKLKSVETAGTENKPIYRGPFNSVQYIFNNPQQPALWYSALQDNLAGIFSTLPDYDPTKATREQE